MPTIIQGNVSYAKYGGTDNFDYNYPKGLNLDPKGQLHNKLATKLYQYAFDSSAEISKRYPYWKEIDNVLTAYVDLTDKELTIQSNDNRKPVGIVVPISYATLEVLLTYFTSVFLETPYFRYGGVDSQDVVGALLLEKVIDIQCMRKKVGLNLHTMFRDNLVYGFGAVAPIWVRDVGVRTEWQDASFMSKIFGGFRNVGQQRVKVEKVVYEGNMMKNIDPYKYLPDPSVPIHDTQGGEYVGWIESTNYLKLVSMEGQDPTVFNVKYLNVWQGPMTSQFNKADSDSGRGTKWSTGTRYSNNVTRPIDVVWMYVTLIPKEWELGGSENPEKWLFGLAADTIIICAKPLGLDHGMYPVGVCATDYDGYSVTPIGKLELTYGLQKALNWLFDSHIANVRKALNDMLIVDPSLININDLRDPAPGKLIRMRRAAWGRGVENAVKQLKVEDVTQGHIADSSRLMDLISQITGSVDSIQGVIRKTAERVTAEEVKGTRSSALSRLARAAKIASMQAMFDLGYMLASHTQQLMTKDQFVEITGDFSADLMKAFPGQKIVKVTPQQMSIDYDIVMKDGSTQGGEYVDVWVDIFKVITGTPALMGSFDIQRIFGHVARLMGAKDIDSFLIQQQQQGQGVPQVQTQVQPEEQIQDQVQKGNYVPTNEYAQAMSQGGGEV